MKNEKIMISVQSPNLFCVKKSVCSINQAQSCDVKKSESNTMPMSHIPASALKANCLKGNQISFGTLKRCTVNGNILDTWFFRKLETLKAVKKHIHGAFPEGTTILHCAGSAGQEAYTDAMMLNNPMYKIISLDIDPEALELAKLNNHSIVPTAEDGFLIHNSKNLTPEQQNLQGIFKKFFKEIQKPEKPLNNRFYYKDEKFFKASDEINKRVEFANVDEGNVLDIDKFRPEEKVGAVYFRNGTYFLSKNNVLEVIHDTSDPNLVNIDALGKMVEKVHSRLEDNGIFVLGSNAKEHLYLAPEGTLNSSVTQLKDTSLYNNLDKYSREYIKNMAFYNKSPLETALEKDGKFAPVFWDSVDLFPEIKVATVWKKVAANN